jgi:hypothetical protein
MKHGHYFCCDLLVVMLGILANSQIKALDGWPKPMLKETVTDNPTNLFWPLTLFYFRTVASHED